MPTNEELEAVREHFGGDHGAVEHVTRALGERENARAYGQDTGRADKVLAGFGWPPPAATSAEAGKARAAAAERDDSGKDAREQPPRGRRAAPRETGNADG